MRVDKALEVLDDFMKVCKDNNDDPIIIVKSGDGDDEVYNPIKAVSYMVGNGGNYLNLWTKYTTEDDAITLSELIKKVDECKWPYDRIMIDNKTEVTSFRIKVIDLFKVIEVI